MNFAISEYALDLKNPFVGMYHDRLAGVSKRLPIPIDENAGAIIPHRSGWIFWLAGVKLHQC